MKEFSVDLTTYVRVPFTTLQTISIPEEFLSKYDEDDYEEAIKDYIWENDLITDNIQTNIEWEIKHNRKNNMFYTETGAWILEDTEFNEDWEIHNIEEWD